MRHSFLLLTLLLALAFPGLALAQNQGNPYGYAVLCTGANPLGAFLRDYIELVEEIPAASDQPAGIFYQNQIAVNYEEGMVIGLGRPDLGPYWTDALLRITVEPSGQSWEYAFRQGDQLVSLDESQFLNDLLVPGENIMTVSLETPGGSIQASPPIWITVWQSCKTAEPDALAERPLAPVSPAEANDVTPVAERAWTVQEVMPLIRRWPWLLSFSVLAVGLVWGIQQRRRG